VHDTDLSSDIDFKGQRGQGVKGQRKRRSLVSRIGRSLTNAQFSILIYHPKGSAIHHGNAMSEKVARSDSARKETLFDSFFFARASSVLPHQKLEPAWLPPFR
jgi:hypothetical protein